MAQRPRPPRTRTDERLLREALEARRRTLGDEHPGTLKTKQLLEELLAEQSGKEEDG